MKKLFYLILFILLVGLANAQPKAASCDLICDLFFSNAWRYGVGWLDAPYIYKGNTDAFDDRLITEFPKVAFVSVEGKVMDFSYHTLITYEETGKFSGKFYNARTTPRQCIGSHKRGYNNRDFIYDENGNEVGFVSYSDSTPLPQIASAAAYLLLILKLESPGKIKYNNK